MKLTSITVTVGATIQARQYEPLHVEITMSGSLFEGDDAQEASQEIYAEARTALRATLYDVDNPAVKRWLESTMLLLPGDVEKPE